MSTATQQKFYKSLDGQNVNFLKDWLLDTSAGTAKDLANFNDAGGAQVVGQMKLVGPTGTAQDRAARRLEVTLDTGVLKQVAWVEDLTQFWRSRGTHGVATLPTAAGATTLTGEPLRAYDTFLITTPQTFTGIQGDDALDAGDILVLVDDADPTDPANWLGVSQSTAAVSARVGPETQTVSLVADTALTVTAASVTNIVDFLVLDSTGYDITSAISVQLTGANTLSLMSSLDLANVAVTMFDTTG